MKSRMYWADHSEPGKVAGSQKESLGGEAGESFEGRRGGG